MWAENVGCENKRSIEILLLHLLKGYYTMETHFLVNFFQSQA